MRPARRNCQMAVLGGMVCLVQTAPSSTAALQSQTRHDEFMSLATELLARRTDQIVQNTLVAPCRVAAAVRPSLAATCRKHQAALGHKVSSSPAPPSQFTRSSRLGILRISTSSTTTASPTSTASQLPALPGDSGSSRLGHVRFPGVEA